MHVIRCSILRLDGWMMCYNAPTRHVQRGYERVLFVHKTRHTRTKIFIVLCLLISYNWENINNNPPRDLKIVQEMLSAAGMSLVEMRQLVEENRILKEKNRVLEKELKSAKDCSTFHNRFASTSGLLTTHSCR